MAKSKNTLGRSLLATLQELNGLIDATDDEDQHDQLMEQRTELLKHLGALVDQSLDQSTQEYKQATARLDQASVSLKKAIKGLGSVAGAIASVTSAIEAITQLV
jgi:ElaB/YqjD/DUF883 family membrane-anchored ribosome-binding protein